MSPSRVLGLLGLSWLVASAALPQEPLSRSERAVINYAFASQLGSGIYDIDGRTVQVYRLPLAYTLREEGERRWGLKLTLPVTLGLFDFRAVDLPETGLPDGVDTVSFVPGVELRVPVGGHLLLKPFAEAGLVRDRAGDADASVYAAGLRSLADFRPGAFSVDVGNGLVYSRVELRRDHPSDDYALFETSVLARHALGFAVARHEVDIGVYGTVDLYLDDPDVPIEPRGSASAGTSQYEIGVTFGTVDEVRLWKVRLPRLGVGYRFGSGLSSWRLVIGLPTKSLKR